MSRKVRTNEERARFSYNVRNEIVLNKRTRCRGYKRPYGIKDLREVVFSISTFIKGNYRE